VRHRSRHHRHRRPHRVVPGDGPAHHGDRLPVARAAAPGERVRRPAAGRRTVAPGRLRAMMTTFAFFGAAVFAAGQQPTLLEFARGTEIAAPGSEPVARVTLPEHVYTTSVKSGLADLRVFNRA